MHKTVHALVLRQTPYKEYDSILTVLSAEEGRLTVNAKGARRRGSPVAAASQLLCYSRMFLSEYRERLSLREAEIQESFQGLRGDVERLALGVYLCDMAALFLPEQEPSEEILRLTLAALSLLCKETCEVGIIKAAAEFAVLCRAGFAPDLSGCADCGRGTAPLLFDTTEGLLYCPGCAPSGCAPLSGGVLAALRHVGSALPQKTYAFRLNDDETRRLGYVCEQYMLCQTGKAPASLTFYKDLRTDESS